MIQKPSIPKGTRDFGQQEMAERNYIFDTIKNVFGTFGYSQIETPAMENLNTLLGKYGDEGDKLLFRILNSGNAFSNLDTKEFLKGNELDDKNLTSRICEKGLRYDLTVPFARYVVMHQNEISFPFKRYQIQPVWRADKPQKGRYREFCQCDADVIGSKSQVNELELVQIVDRVFSLLGINVLIKINNRKVLTGFAEICGFPDKVVDITVAIDKLDKIGLENVEAEMKEKGLSDSAIEVIRPILLLKGNTDEKISDMRKLMDGGSASGIKSETGLKGLEELEELFDYIASAGIKQQTEIDLSLARGLNYYTGAIFEVKALDFAIGSICGGGRYDNLTGIFGLPDMSGVGISFGADRIYDVLKGTGKFPEHLSTSSKILFADMGKEELKYIFPVVKRLREAGIACEVYPSETKLKKQFEYANKKNIPFISINGETERQERKINIKNLTSGEQKSFTEEDTDSIIVFLS
jgi:histidyl-tRNA synthetase